MRDANQITDLLFTIDEIEHKVCGVYLTQENKLYVKLLNPENGAFVNYFLGEFQPFIDRNDVKLDIVPNSLASRDLINRYIRKNLNRSSAE